MCARARQAACAVMDVIRAAAVTVGPGLRNANTTSRSARGPGGGGERASLRGPRVGEGLAARACLRAQRLSSPGARFPQVPGGYP